MLSLRDIIIPFERKYDHSDAIAAGSLFRDEGSLC